jgi:hypothetical protein
MSCYAEYAWRTAASLALEAGVAMKKVPTGRGHSTSITADLYTHVSRSSETPPRSVWPPRAAAPRR